MWDVTLLLRAQEVLVGYAVISPFLLAEIELHVIMDVRSMGDSAICLIKV